jgi:hypothetical protein
MTRDSASAGIRRHRWLGAALRALVLAPLLASAAAGQAPTGPQQPPPAKRLTVQPFVLQSVANTAYGRVGIDGPLRPGKGAGISVSGGVAARWGILEVQLRPLATLEHRLAFATAGDGDPNGGRPHAIYANRIDWPQAWATGTQWELYPGDSYVSLRPVEALALSFSTERRRWGPAERNGLILSGNGPGFPHFALGTTRPVGTAIGGLEVELLVGALSASPYFESPLATEGRRFVAVASAFSPRFVPGLTVGLIGVQHEMDSTSVSGLSRILELPLSFFAGRVANNLKGNGLASLYLRWLFPESGLELYGELARDDHAEDLQDLLREPDHSLASVLGFRKAFGGASGGDEARSSIGIELAELRSPMTMLGRRSTVEQRIYTHSPVTQGHTQEGRLLGAPIGPGSRAALAYLDVVGSAQGRRSRLSLERIEYDGITFANRYAPIHGDHGRDVEWTLGLGHLRSVGALALDGGIELSRRSNRSFIGFDPTRGASDSLPVEHNVRLDLRLVWSPGGAGAASAARLGPRPLGRR